MAPFQAVPSPGPVEHPSAPLPDLADLDRGDPGLHATGKPPPAASPALSPAVSGAAYRDWTRPSGRADSAPPETTAIPDRELRGRTGAAAPGEPATGSQTAVIGGRAALRAERQAADTELRKAARRTGTPVVRPWDEPEEEPARPRRRRAIAGLLAMVVVALVVLGVYSFTSPAAQEAADDRPAPATTSAAAPAETSGALPPLSAVPLPPVEEAPATPVRVPVTVLNATQVNGLAGSIAATLEGGGWPTSGVGAYEGGDVPVTTVYFTEGDETQRQSALQLVEAHPEVTGPAVRFFEVPGDADPGLVVVAAGEWRP